VGTTIQSWHDLAAHDTAVRDLLVHAGRYEPRLDGTDVSGYLWTGGHFVATTTSRPKDMDLMDSAMRPVYSRPDTTCAPDLTNLPYAEAIAAYYSHAGLTQAQVTARAGKGQGCWRFWLKRAAKAARYRKLAGAVSDQEIRDAVSRADRGLPGRPGRAAWADLMVAYIRTSSQSEAAKLCNGSQSTVAQAARRLVSRLPEGCPVRACLAALLSWAKAALIPPDHYAAGKKGYFPVTGPKRNNLLIHPLSVSETHTGGGDA
jgi:hypothetical protein